MKNLVSINDLGKKDIVKIFEITDRIKRGGLKDSMKDRRLALLFEKPSTRTRTSFESGMLMLGGSPIYLDTKTMQASRGETYQDTSKILSLYTDIIAARMNKHSDLLEFAKASDVPVINALTDLEHPCQALSDIYTIREIRKDLNGIKLSFVGDIATNTANSLLLASTKLGMKFSMVGPHSIKPNAEYLKKARSQGIVSISDSLKNGLKDSEFVYTDTWVSMGEESIAKKKKKELSGYQVNKKAMSYASNGSFFMHCLPAHRGEEVTSEVIDGKSYIIWEQARNKMYVEAAILVYLSSQIRK